MTFAMLYIKASYAHHNIYLVPIKQRKIILHRERLREKNVVV